MLFKSVGRNDKKQPSSAGLENQFWTVIKRSTGLLCRFHSLCGRNLGFIQPKAHAEGPSVSKWTNYYKYNYIFKDQRTIFRHTLWQEKPSLKITSARLEKKSTESYKKFSKSPRLQISHKCSCKKSQASTFQKSHKGVLTFSWLYKQWSSKVQML